MRGVKGGGKKAGGKKACYHIWNTVFDCGIQSQSFVIEP